MGNPVFAKGRDFSLPQAGWIFANLFLLANNFSKKCIMIVRLGKALCESRPKRGNGCFKASGTAPKCTQTAPKRQQSNA
jgi:hypothetical protein